MELPKVDLTGLNYPLKTLVWGSWDSWNNLMLVIEDLTEEQLNYCHPNIEQRSIKAMVKHAIDTPYAFFTKVLVLGEKYQEIDLNSVDSLAGLQNKAVEYFQKTIDLWKTLTPEDLNKEIKTEWGQVLTGEQALIQAISHTNYHVSEICFLRGLGGFPTKVMG